MSNEWYPEIDEELCVSCKNCIDVCNSSVFEIFNNEVKVMYTEECIFECIKCQDSCPKMAISYVVNLYDIVNKL